MSVCGGVNRGGTGTYHKYITKYNKIKKRILHCDHIPFLEYLKGLLKSNIRCCVRLNPYKKRLSEISEIIFALFLVFSCRILSKSLDIHTFCWIECNNFYSFGVTPAGTLV